jgi:hypothetical protein
MRTCLPSRCLVAALVYLLISQSLHSNGSTRYNNTFMKLLSGSLWFCCKLSENVFTVWDGEADSLISRCPVAFWLQSTPLMNKITLFALALITISWSVLWIYHCQGRHPSSLSRLSLYFRQGSYRFAFKPQRLNLKDVVSNMKVCKALDAGNISRHSKLEMAHANAYSPLLQTSEEGFTANDCDNLSVTETLCGSVK